MREPQIHSNIEDSLPEKHPLAYEIVSCATCNEMLHACNNECMETWVETGRGNFCIKCFMKLGNMEILDGDLGLSVGETMKLLALDTPYKVTGPKSKTILGPDSRKPYKCDTCGHEFIIETNHWENIQFCPKCCEGTYKRVTAKCQEPIPKELL